MRPQSLLLGSCLLLVIAFCACHEGTLAGRHAKISSSLKKQKREADALAAKRKWNLSTSLDAYRDVGTHNPLWDAEVMAALKIFALTRGVSWAHHSYEEDVLSACKQAAEKGCNDPFVHQLLLRFSSLDVAKGVENSGALHESAMALEHSGYPSVRKLYGWTEAISYCQIFDITTNNLEMLGFADKHLRELIANRRMPDQEFYFAAQSVMCAHVQTKQSLATFETNMLPLVSTRLKGTYLEPLLRGQLHVESAWQARGTGYADTISEAGWKQMGEHLTMARAAFQEAWNYDSEDKRAPTEMLRVMLLDAKSEAEREMWFQRAMTTDTNNYEACRLKLSYLQPKWGGSVEDLVGFGRECLTNKLWGPDVPYTLVQAHLMVGEMIPNGDYFKEPMVWDDFQLAYDELIHRNPTHWMYLDEYAGHAEFYHYKELAEKIKARIPSIKEAARKAEYVPLPK